MSQRFTFLLPKVIETALEAGHEIMQIYETGFNVEWKDNHSPLTLADKRAHQAIYDRLSDLFPVLSEEGKTIDYNERKRWDVFWMVDPLDGTKEFIRKNGEFTVNIALIKEQVPVLGVVYAPALNVLYFGDESTGSFKTTWLKHEQPDAHAIISSAIKIPVSRAGRKFTVVASRSHMTSETRTFIEKLKKEHGDIEFISSGSSLKLCLVAEGVADVYPRLAPTSEWDTAAGHAVVLYAGKSMVEYDSGLPVKYNKPDLLNAWFVVS